MVVLLACFGSLMQAPIASTWYEGGKAETQEVNSDHSGTDGGVDQTADSEQLKGRPEMSVAALPANGSNEDEQWRAETAGVERQYSVHIV